MFLFAYSVWLLCKLETLFKKWTTLIHHSSTENDNGHWSNSSWLNKGLLWGSDVPALQILRHCSGNIIQLKGLVCWYSTFHCSCFFCSEENSCSSSEIPRVPGLPSWGVHCQPSWHTHEPAPGVLDAQRTAPFCLTLASHLFPSRCPHGSSAGSPC